MSKTVLNKKTELTNSEGKIDRNSFLKFIVNEPTKEGLTIIQMRERMRIIDAIDNAGEGNVTLEDHDFNLLKNIFDNFRFYKPHKDILELANHLEELSKQKKK